MHAVYVHKKQKTKAGVGYSYCTCTHVEIQKKNMLPQTVQMSKFIRTLLTVQVFIKLL